MREWPHTMLKPGDAGLTRGFTITCATCGDTDAVAGQQFGARAAAQLVPEKFRRKGWVIGRRAEHDECPACAAKAKARERLTRESLPVSPPPFLFPPLRLLPVRLSPSPQHLMEVHP